MGDVVRSAFQERGSSLLATRERLAPRAAVPTADLDRALDRAIARSRRYLLDLQHGGGYWASEIGADTTLVSDAIMFCRLLGRVDRRLERGGVRDLLDRQLPDGGWNIYHGGASELNASVKAYFALKLAGLPQEDARMRSACATIRRLGGLERINSYERLYLGLFGLYPWRDIPAIPPELMLLPPRGPISIYDFSAWSRTIIVPLSILYAVRPERRVPGLVLGELRTGKRVSCRGTTLRSLSWQAPVRAGFLALDRAFKRLEPVLRRLPTRRTALERAERWVVERVGAGGLGAIYPAMVNAILALDALGYKRTHPVFARAWNAFLDLAVGRGEAIRFLPCTSPVWDTALALYALLVSGVRPEAAPARGAARWLYAKQVPVRGDWAVKNPRLEPGGWFFEFENVHYPDTDDTTIVLMALDRCLRGEREDRREAFRRGLRWLLGMQNRDGGWGAFDRDLDKKVLEAIPFADHNAMLDGSTADITGRVLELLGQLGMPREAPVIRRAVRFLRREQEPDGSWFGRWGVNYIYGTAHVLQGLRAIGEPLDRPLVRRAARWLESVQNPDGGWGETCETYRDPSRKGRGPSTASQTAWAILGLLAAGEAESRAVLRGIAYLLRTQNPDGSWYEEAYTGTGFPRVFYLEYTMYRQYFPLMALAKSRILRRDPRAFIGRPASLGESPARDVIRAKAGPGR